ncbi:MAG: DUF3105 domain-containing protein [Candidatus Sungbacteria bacterium]|nr:DUF3105 domain-containing protein [Candidatus Sungbacteria bacterium]
MADTNFSKGELKKIRATDALKRKKLKRIIWIIAVVVVLAGGIYWIVRYNKEKKANLPGIFYTDVGQDHIGLNDAPPKPYSSNPPSSGGHYGQWANWGVYDYEVNDKIFMHNLEHGGIWIAYRPTVSPPIIDDLKGIVKEFGGSKLVMAPRSANDADIAIVSWARVFKFDVSGKNLTDSEKEQIRAFYRGFKNRGLEFVPDTMPGVDPKSIQ